MTADAGAWDLDAGRGVVARLIGEDRAAQIELVAARPDGNEYLLVDRADGNVRIEANTRSPCLPVSTPTSNAWHGSTPRGTATPWTRSLAFVTATPEAG